MVAFAIVDDVQAVWETTLSSEQRTMVGVRLEQASAIIRQEVGVVGGFTVDQRAASNPNFGLVVRGVTRDMVVRLLQNPQGRRQVAIDDASVTYDAAISSGQLYLSDMEFRSLAGGGRAVEGQQVRGAFTIRPAYTPGSYPPDPWLALGSPVLP